MERNEQRLYAILLAYFDDDILLLQEELKIIEKKVQLSQDKRESIRDPLQRSLIDREIECRNGEYAHTLKILQAMIARANRLREKLSGED